MFPEWVLVIPLVLGLRWQEISTAGNIVFESRFENFDDCHTFKSLKVGTFEAMEQYAAIISSAERTLNSNISQI